MRDLAKRVQHLERANDSPGLSGLSQGVTSLNKTTKDIIAGTVSTIRVTVYTANGTYTKPSNLLYVEVECYGGGGGGGGANVAAAGGAAGGGAQGNFARKLLKSNEIDVTEGIVVGAGGAGGASSGASGTAGGVSNFGIFCIASGGLGGVGNTTTGGTAKGGISGTSITGDFGIRGNPGMPNSYDVANNPVSGCGGGPGGESVFAANAGQAGVAYGGGGSGAASNSSSAQAGGAGYQGVVIVKEYLA